MLKRPHILRLLPLLLLAGLALLYLRSFFVSDILSGNLVPSIHTWSLQTQHGRITLWHTVRNLQRYGSTINPPGIHWDTHIPSIPHRAPAFFGFAYCDAFEIAGRTTTLSALTIPLPQLAIPLTIPLLLTYLRRRRHLTSTSRFPVTIPPPPNSGASP